MIRSCAFAGCVLTSLPAAVAEPLPGPVPAELVRVIDGDTVEVRAHIWPGHYVQTRVRLAGVDTPETYRPGCPAERAAGEAARAFTESWLLTEDGYARVGLKDVDLGSFAGRVIARIERSDGADLSAALIAARHAVPYGQDAPWCAAGPAPSR